jgi:hypothetical protein
MDDTRFVRTKCNSLKEQQPANTGNELPKDTCTYKVGNTKFRVTPVYKKDGARGVADALIALLTSDDK